jgi:hypothetical protein
MLIKEITEGTRCWKGYKKKGMKTMFGKRVPNCVKNEDVTKGNFGGVIYPQLPHQEVLDAISSWEYGDTPIELTNGFVINAREEGYNDDDNAWVLLDPQGKIVDAGEGSIEDVMQDFTPIAIEENLRAWFGKGKKGGAGGGGWDRYNTKGERIGKCGDAKKGEGKPKCLSKSRAASLRAKGGKKAIGAAVSKKRRNDPNKNRKGKAKNVSNTVGKK